MKIFLSYRFTGEDPEELKIVIENICKSLEKSGNEVYCSFFDGEYYKKNKFTNRQILEHTLNKLNQSDVYLAFIKSDQKSEGMLIEAGYAIANRKKIVLAIKKGIKTTFMHQMADKLIEFHDLNEIYSKLENLIL